MKAYLLLFTFTTRALAASKMLQRKNYWLHVCVCVCELECVPFFRRRRLPLHEIHNNQLFLCNLW